MVDQLFRMMQLADSAFPLGGFAFSNGLEWLVKHQKIQSLEGFQDYLLHLVRQAYCFEIPFLLAMGTTPEGDLGASSRWDLMLQVPGARKASLAQGRALLRLLPVLFDSAGEEKISAALDGGNESPHLVPVLGRVLSHLGWEADLKVRLWTYLLVRDQTSAAIRLGILGPAGALGVQDYVYARAQWKPDQSPSWNEAYRITVMNDMALAGHEQLYSRLFQN